MTEREARFEGDSYTVIAWAYGQTPLLYHAFGSYQGEWLLFAADDEKYLIYEGSYGSCSGCDSLQAMDGPSHWTRKKALEFAKDYKPFAEIPKKTAINLAKSGNLARVFPGNIRDTYSDIDVPTFAKDCTMIIKCREHVDVTPAEIIECKNSEVRRVALERYGIDQFIKDSKPVILDTAEPNQLLQYGDHLYLFLKDASTPRRYLLQVPESVKTVRDGIAWSFGMRTEEYAPLIET